MSLGAMTNDMSSMAGGAGGGSNAQYLEELAFQESMLRLRQQQQQQQQQLQQNAGGGADSGSYVDPILGSMALSQNSLNTTPMAASQQYWRRQALLDASSHMDSLRMAQAGAIGIQRPTLEPGSMRDLRVPNNLMGGNMNMPGDDFQQQQQMEGGAKDIDAGGMMKKRRGSSAAAAASEEMVKRMRRSNDPDGQQRQPNQFYH